MLQVSRVTPSAVTQGEPEPTPLKSSPRPNLYIKYLTNGKLYKDSGILPSFYIGELLNLENWGDPAALSLSM